MPYATIDNIRLYYEQCARSAPPLLLIHGAGQDTLSWRFCLQGLARQFSVVAIDLAGHGKSDRRPDGIAIDSYRDHLGYVDGLMRHLGHERYFVMGHSFAGMLGLLLALDHPGRIQGLVMIDGAGCPSGAWGGAAFDLVGINPIDWMEVNFRLICGPHTDSRRVDYIAQDVLRCPPDVVQADIRAFARMDLRDRLPAMTTPLLAFHGLDDWSIPPRLGEETTQRAGGLTRFVPLPDVGHFPHVEAPDRFLDTFETEWPAFARQIEERADPQIRQVSQ